MAETVMAKNGMLAEKVGAWAKEKHAYLRRYVTASGGARKGFIGKAGATFVDLFCGYGCSNIRDTPEFIVGSPIAAWEESLSSPAPFSHVYIADIDSNIRATCGKRLAARMAPVIELEGDALTAAAQYRQAVNSAGLHLAFLDPHSLGDLNFKIIEELSNLQRIDMLIHVSVMDMQRNLRDQIEDKDAAEFDAFAPGWRNKIDFNGPQGEVRRRLLEYWSELVRSLGMLPFTDSRLIKGDRGQRLYWLMLAAKSTFAKDLWKKLGRADRQGELFG